MAPRREPIWLALDRVLAIHDLMLAQYGGLAGVRDRGALESALGRPMNRRHSGEDDLFELAACCGFGLAKNHPFADGNKRTAFVSMATFCEANHAPLAAAEIDVVHIMVAVAGGEMTEKKLAAWLRENTAKPRRRKRGH